MFARPKTFFRNSHSERSRLGCAPLLSAPRFRPQFVIRFDKPSRRCQNSLPELGRATLRPWIAIFAVVLLAGLAFFLRTKLPARTPEYCSHTAYGHGVTCIGGAGNGGTNVNISSKTVPYSPAAGHAVIVSAYTCADKDCQEIPVTTLTIGDNVRNPEPCFEPSPHSPFALNETSAGTQKLQEYIWVCPNIPPGVTSFTATCSAEHACTYITLTATEWTGLATSDVFDADGGAASSVQQNTATISTSSPTRYTNDLIYTFMDNTGDETMTPAPPYRTVLQFFRGNINTGAVIENTGVQTTTATWKGNDDWYGAMAAIRTAASQPAQPHP